MKTTKYNNLQELIFDRNRLLKKFFTDRGFDVELIGDQNQPAVIVKNFGELFAVGAHVKNFKYNFTNIPFNGHIVKSVDLNQEEELFSRQDLIEIIENTEQREVYVLKKYENPEMYFNSIVQKNGTQHVYWSETDPHYFLVGHKAVDMKINLFKEFNIRTLVHPE